MKPGFILIKNAEFIQINNQKVTNEPLPGLKPGVSGLWHTCHDLQPCQTCRKRPPLRSERMPFIPRFKSLGFSGMAHKVAMNNLKL
jgi:hypothetical protein